MLVTLIILLQACKTLSVQMDVIDCGIDHALDVADGEVELSQYPWVGILFYTYYGMEGDSRSVTTVVLIQKEFVIAAAADIGPMPKTNFRKNTRVLLGEGWNRPGRRVRNYVIHPEYGETYNTVALVQLSSAVRDITIKPVCPPPDILRNPVFYVIKMKEEVDILEKEVINVMHVPGKMCKDFYVAANLYSRKMRPPYVACAVATQSEGVCVWGAGSALVSRDVWGRWQLLGLGVRGPGCSAPSRYLDMMSYYPWVEHSLAQFNRITISKISKQKYVLRASETYQKFGACDAEEKINLIFRESIVLRTDNTRYQFLTYNISIVEIVEYTCLTLELRNASAVSELRIKHYCPRINYEAPCHFYRGSVLEISVFIMFSDKCLFEMMAWGFRKNMTLLDIQEWKWEEGTYYEDFSMTRVEYRGPTYQTDFGYEPLDIGVWVPEYDIWTTTEAFNVSSTTAIPINVSKPRPSRPTSSTKRTKKKLKRKTKTTLKPTGQERRQNKFFDRKPLFNASHYQSCKSVPGVEKTPEKGSVGLEKTPEKESVGDVAKTPEKETVGGVKKAPEKESVGGVENTPEMESVRAEKTPEKESVGLEKTLEKESVGLEKTLEKETVGAEKTPEKESFGFEKTPKK